MHPCIDTFLILPNKWHNNKVKTMLLRYFFPVGYQKPVLPEKHIIQISGKQSKQSKATFFLLPFTNLYYFEKKKETIFIGQRKPVLQLI